MLGYTYTVHCLSCPVQKRPETQEEVTFISEGRYIDPTPNPAHKFKRSQVALYFASVSFKSFLFCGRKDKVIYKYHAKLVFYRMIGAKTYFRRRILVWNHNTKLRPNTFGSFGRDT